MIPEAIIVAFGEDDVILTSSGTGTGYGQTGDEWWGDEQN